MDTFPPALQRPDLLKFAESLCSDPRSLRRDECGDWRINGATGHLYAYAEGRYQFFVFTESVRAWNSAKKKLSFARLCNDGDEEGGFFLDRHPTDEEAKTIRYYLGLKKRREYSPETLERLRLGARTTLIHRPTSTDQLP